MTKQIRPAGFPWLSPYVTVKDVQAAAEFYKKAFGFGIKDIAEGPDGIPGHAELTYQDQVIMIGREGDWGEKGKISSPKTSGTASPINIYIYTENVDAFYKKALAAGAKSLGEPTDMFWGDRMCNLEDLDGYNWCFATHTGAVQDKHQHGEHCAAGCQL
jgi:uncharacterized glyoxalase superfamily protein PhnB